MEARKLVQDLFENNTIINSNTVSDVGKNLRENYFIHSINYLDMNKIQEELEAVIWLYIYQMSRKPTPGEIRKQREKYINIPRKDLREHYRAMTDKDIEFIIITNKEDKYIKKIMDILCPFKSKYLKGEYKHLMEKNKVEILNKISKFSDIVKTFTA